MPRVLDVYLHRSLIGKLTQSDTGQIAFRYLEASLEDKDAVPLSQSLPLRTEPFKQSECAGFFGGLLPELGQREVLAKNLGVSARNDFALLEKIGGECAGAVTFLPQGEPLPSPAYRYRELSEHELAETLLKLPRRPLLAGEEGIRLSLAGAQNKIAVCLSQNTISLPLGQSPSTHILKPDNLHFENTVDNEAFCMRLARTIRLPVPHSEIRQAEDVRYLLVQRYDRLIEPAKDGGAIHRLHQEDFCQALGVISDRKYQNEGGPSLQQCFQLLRAVSTVPARDLLALLDGVIFNFLIANNDAHAKNFSLLYGGSGPSRQVRLAPFYDLLSTAYYPELSAKMAMKIGGEYESGRVLPRHFERLADEAGLAPRLVKGRVIHLANALLRALVAPSNNVESKIQELIRASCERTIRIFAG